MNHSHSDVVVNNKSFWRGYINIECKKLLLEYAILLPIIRINMAEVDYEILLKDLETELENYSTNERIKKDRQFCRSFFYTLLGSLVK